MTPESIDAWLPFAAAVLGAAAVLVGLIFVALSINLDSLLAQPLLLRRAGSAIVLLMSVLVASLFVLIPHQTGTILGTELIGIGLVGATVIGGLLARPLRHIDPAYRAHFRQALGWSWAVQIAYVICGITLIAGVEGLYWLVAATVIGLCRSILESWVLLVEVKR